jgi:pyrimidine operon attenuation protein / uracil phosphoribosyltransferase
MKTKEKLQILDPTGLSRVLTRIAHEIIERNKGADNLVLVGMVTRGVVLAKRLAKKITQSEKKPVKTGVLDATLYRDDFRSGGKQPAVRVTDIPFSIQDRDVIMVDDVLYTGRTARAALDALMDLGRPRTVQFAVLIDRGLREMPIHADYVGKQVSTSANEEIRVKVMEVDKEDGVWLVEVKK